MSAAPVRLGVAGLGRAFMLMLPTFTAHPRIRLAAAADPRAEARRQFESDFGGSSYTEVEQLCQDPGIDAVYIATPHEFHAEHARCAARAGKHVLVEKPMAVTLDECQAMIDAARSAGVVLVIGHSHSFDLPVLRTRELIASGRYGRVRMITALNYTDFLYRPRRPAELDTSVGGGVVFSQGAHQVDVVRLLAGDIARSVYAQAGSWDASRPTEGAYAAQLGFEGGTFASLAYSGYAHFDSDELMGWIGETGFAKSPSYGAARASLLASQGAADELDLKTRRTYGRAPVGAALPQAHNQFGFVIASCEHADLRPMPSGVMIYDDRQAAMEPLAPPTVPRGEVIDEFCDAIAGARAPTHTGEWAMATLEVCLAIVESSRSRSEVRLHRQVGVAHD